MVYKFIGTERSIATANTVGDQKLVRVFNSNTTATASKVLTVSNNATVNSTTTISNVTVGSLQSVIVEKATTDFLTMADGLAVAIAFRN